MCALRCEGQTLGDSWGLAVADGELDIATSGQLKDLCHDLRVHGAKRLIVDLSGVTFVDSDGLGLLVAEQRRSGPLHLIVTQPQMLRVFGITGLDKLFILHASLDEALEATAD